MEIAYWIVAGLLAAFYLFGGSKKVIQSQEQLAPMMAWAGTTVPMWLVRCIGVIEVLGAFGLLLPPALGIAPVVALLTAVGFVVLQILAAGVHFRRGETKEVGLNIALIVVAAAAAWLATVW
ncbi:DoxX family protein [Aldersonia kunmingensis]|uniref:DoxX family protein n=1 Tax=Aldersonia kunmingensis TaxID=408066 RepID=UPI0008330460|nr:DoxX family protein [Aldersonia kunmingensis]